MARRSTAATRLLADVHACRLCEAHLPHGVRPVLQLHPDARILIAGQAPGRRVHESGVPFDDASGDRLRDWLGVDRATFYDQKAIAILPMGFCYPGTGKNGDLPPRPECAAAWRQPLLALLRDLRWTFVVGRYAMDWHLDADGADVTSMVRAFAGHRARRVTALPHPSPRNNAWLQKNPWFEREVLPEVRRRVRAALRVR
jgi:uracil-DNA glycosylase